MHHLRRVLFLREQIVDVNAAAPVEADDGCGLPSRLRESGPLAPAVAEMESGSGVTKGREGAHGPRTPTRRLHRPTFGLLHGTLLCLGIGLYLGALRRRPVRGAVAGAAIGLGAAAGYYALATVMGYAAMFVLWMALWAGFGLLHGRGLGEPLTSRGEALGRSALAAVGSGLAFYAISGIWTRPAPGPPDYAYHFSCWTVAFLPGFLANLVVGPTDARRSPLRQ